MDKIEGSSLKIKAKIEKKSSFNHQISLRIAAAVFFTILIFQMFVLAMNANQYENHALEELTRVAKSTVKPLLTKTEKLDDCPLPHDFFPALVSETIIKGITLYNMEKKIVCNYGLDTSYHTFSEINKLLIPAYLTDKKDLYEVLSSPAQIDLPYYLMLKLDSSSVHQNLHTYIIESAKVMILMSILVTLILMWVLERWLLEPLMLLHKNLTNAVSNPEFPTVEEYARESNDEIGVAVSITNGLIKQNASNIKKLKEQAEDRIHKLAYFDSITGLPNRTFFLEQLQKILSEKKFDHNYKFAVMSVDIDHFKDINDSMGHEIGDLLLEAVGKRLVKALPDSAIISRSSADEFLVLVELNKYHSDSSQIVEKIMDSMEEPVSIIQERFQVRVSIGVAQYPEDGIDARKIIKNSDIALNRAKDDGRNLARYYSEEFDLVIQQRFQLLRDLRIALDKEELDLHYQPQFDLRSGEIIGAEALLRWYKVDETTGLGEYIPPSEIIPIAEHSGLIIPISEYVLRKACQNNKKWQAKGLKPLKIGVNLSWEQFHKGDLIKLVKDTLDETGLKPKWLELEVTESLFMENTEMAIDKLHQLKSIGVDISIDDFGTGYSSLSYLKQFPIDKLKIDQSFIRDALTDTDDKIITRTIINLGHSLGLKVIAEGVETLEHETLLYNEGCDEAQGYKYSKPIPEKDFVDFLKNHNPKTITDNHNK